MTGGRARVAVNLLWLVPGVVGGSEEYTVRLLHGLADLAPDDLDVELFALDDLARAHPDLVARFPTHTVGLRGRAKPLRILAETTWLAVRVRRGGFDLVHHAGGVVPLVTGAPAVLTIHDLQPLDHPENFSRARVAYLRALLPRSARRAKVITTPSDAAAWRVAELLGVEPTRMVTVPHGLGTELFGPIAPVDVAAAAERNGLAGAWILYPVITYPHKDHVTLVRAFAQLAASHPDVDLVLTGGEGPAEAEVQAAIEASGVAERIRRTGRVPRSELDALMAGAALVAFPSTYEGFGVGVLEAMARGVPVVAADATALPEVLGGAGVLVAPGAVDDWVEALGGLLDDPGRRAELGAAGRTRAEAFTRDAGARALVAAYRRALGRAGGRTDSDGGGRAK